MNVSSDEKPLLTRHVLRTEGVWHFQAEAGRHYANRSIPAGVEEVELIVEGAAVFTFGGDDYPCGPGSILWFQSGMPIMAIADSERPYSCVVFQFAVSGPCGRAASCVGEWLPETEARLFALNALALFDQENVDDLFCPYHYSTLFWHSEQSQKRPQPAQMPSACDRATIFIEEHFGADIRVQDIAAAAGVSAPHLHLLFRRHIGQTPWQLLTTTRFAHARKMLASGDEPVKAVGFACGFSDVAHFCRSFRQHHGCTPSTYRMRKQAPWQRVSGDMHG